MKFKLITCGILCLFILSNYEITGSQRAKKHSTKLKNTEICKIPELNYDLPLERSIPNPACIIGNNWGAFDSLEYKWALNYNIQSEIDSIECKYRKVERIDDFRVKLGKFSALKSGDIIVDDVVEVECMGHNKTGNTTATFNNLYVQVVDKEPERTFDIKKDKNGCFPYNVMLLSYDSVSRVSFMRRLKKTYDLIEKTENFYVLTGYNIVGDGTPQALIPIFTGKTEEELPSALKNDPKGKYVDEVNIDLKTRKKLMLILEERSAINLGDCVDCKI
ncbi:DUF229 domain containing [Brachionus plicatilis]|uniref:DUF229 domain containing n=1 Tax=Brachionus plicatilis TaxID=10195 RepID=A0A3M7RXH2_BRAPC|nr:DUF229 domain containing [Brachionus plicatilis]